MRIRFGMVLDGEHSWARKNGINDVTVGPLGMLSLLETQLGLAAPRPSKAARAIQYREYLKRSNTGDRFYSASFAVDEIGTAATLLDWRDTLILHGWSGDFQDATVPARLADLAAVENDLANDALAPCIGERLTRVAAMLQTRRFAVDQLQIVDPKHLIPARWRAVFALLGAAYAEDLHVPVAAPSPASAPATFLAQLQAALQAPGPVNPVPWQDDGSVTVYCADTQVAAAQWLATLLDNTTGSTLVVNESGGALLDDTLAAFGAPRAGLDEMSAFRPALQVLPLALQLLWTPLNVPALLAFLSLPIAPLRRAWRRTLASAVAQSPGVNGPVWHAALKTIARQCAERGDDVTDAHAQIRAWTQPTTYLAHEQAPIAALIERANAVKTYFYRHLASDDSDLRDEREIHYAGFAQCAAFEAALVELARQGETRLGPNQVNMLLQQATSQGAYNPQRFRQVGCVRTARNPGAVCEGSDTVAWFWAAHPRMPARSPWTSRETATLAAHGVHWPDQAAQLAWQACTWLQPILHAHKRLILVLPACGEATHPVWHTVLAAVSPDTTSTESTSALPITPVEQVLVNKLRGASCQPLTHRALPLARRWWRLPAAVPMPERPHSYTSLHLLINDPCQWVLGYVAELKDSRVLQVKDGALLNGVLAHRLVEMMVGEINAGTLVPDAVPAWIELCWPSLVAEEGAVLLMPGRGADLARVKRRIHAAVVAIAAIIATEKPVRIDAERALVGDFTGGALTGSADLLLHAADGQTAIIDMKWGSDTLHHGALAGGTHVQLLLYAYMEFQRTGRWPGLAYFILETSRIRAAQTGHFKGVTGVRKLEDETTPMLWQRFLANYAWRAAQFKDGAVEVTSAPEPTGESAYPENGMQLSEMKAAWNVYKNLIGWAA